MRHCIPILLALLVAVPLYANTSPLGGSVPSDRRLTFLFEVDFGATPVSWVMTCNLTTNSASGLRVRLIDLDAMAASTQLVPDAVNEAEVAGAGAANAALSGSYSGIREFVVEIETSGTSGSSDYSGQLTVNEGTITQTDNDFLRFAQTGIKTQVGRLAFWDRDVPASTTVPAGVELDFGPTVRTVFVRFEGIGSGIQRLDLIDTTGGTSTTLATFNNPSGGAATTVALTHSGKVALRVNAVGGVGTNGSAAWAITPPTGIRLERSGGDPKEPRKNCSTGEAPSHALWVLLAVLGLAAITRRARAYSP